MGEVFSWTENLDAIVAVGQWAGVLVTLFGFSFLWKQLQREREVLEVQTSAQVYESGIDILKTFIENSELRTYFYDCKPVPEVSKKNDLWARVMTSCEIMCDQWENTFISQNALGKGTNDVWEKYKNGIYLTSPSLRYFLVQEGYRYDSNFIGRFNCYLHEDAKKARDNIENLARKDKQSPEQFIESRHKITIDTINSMQSKPSRNKCSCGQCTSKSKINAHH